MSFTITANEPVKVFVENFVTTQGTQDYQRPSQILFNADCPLEIIKTDNLPFHRVFRTEDGHSYGTSDLRILLENDVFNELPAELKQGIKTVVNSQSAWDKEAATVVTETTHDRLWVPSNNEYFNRVDISADVTGRLGIGMIHGENGFGLQTMLGRSVFGDNRGSLFNATDPTTNSHGSSSCKLFAPGDVMICFGL